MRSTSNQKYEITDIAHESYPFLHRIRARKDIGSQVKAGDLGGFVERESNLSSESGDDAWLFDDAIAAGGAYVDQGSCLRGNAIACDSAYVSRGSVLSGNARAEDNAYLRGAVMTGDTLASGFAQLIQTPDQQGDTAAFRALSCVRLRAGGCSDHRLRCHFAGGGDLQ